MLRTLGIVDVRPTAPMSRLIACRRLGGKPLFEWVVRRLTESQRLSGVIVLAPQIPQVEELRGLVPADVPLHVSNRADSLSRFVAALDEFPADEIVRVSADYPFVDPVLIDRLVTMAANHRDADYIGYCSRNGRPAMMSSLGVLGEWMRAKALRRAEKEASLPAQREHISSYLCAHPEKFALRLLPVPVELDREDVRLTIRDEDDWEHTQMILESLGPDQLDYKRVASLMKQQPVLRRTVEVSNPAVSMV